MDLHQPSQYTQFKKGSLKTKNADEDNDIQI